MLLLRANYDLSSCQAAMETEADRLRGLLSEANAKLAVCSTTQTVEELGKVDRHGHEQILRHYVSFDL